MAVYKNHPPYITARSAVFVNCKSNSGYEEASFDVRKMYVDQDNAPSNIMISPWFKVDDTVESMVLGSTTSPPVVAAVEIRKRPHNAKPQPPQTEDLIFSPANAEISGVITTLVCVRNDARAAGLNSKPAVTSPYFCTVYLECIWKMVYMQLDVECAQDI